MSSVPADPFTDKGMITGGSSGGGTLITWPTYTYESYYFWNAAALLPVRNFGYTWGLYSPGPTRNRCMPNNKTKYAQLAMQLAGQTGYGSWVYDPSNGTTSYGWISRTNKGEVTGADFVGKY